MHFLTFQEYPTVIRPEKNNTFCSLANIKTTIVICGSFFFFFCHLLPQSTCVKRLSVLNSESRNSTQVLKDSDITYSHTQKQNSKRTQFNDFLFVAQAQVPLASGEAGLQSEVLSSCSSTNKHQQSSAGPAPSLPLLTPQSLRVAVINWWQSRSPRSSRGPGSLMPVFWSTHQHFPRWPSRAG